MSDHAHKLTRNQQLVYSRLAGANGPLGAYSILEELRDKGFKAPLQVYRALDKLLEFGMVHRLESVNAFVACRDEKCQSADLTTFAICDTCGKVDEFADKVVADRLQDWATNNNFATSKTSIEIHGKCAVCST